MTVDELRTKVQAVLPELFEAYHEGVGTELSAAMHILETDCNAGATKVLGLVAESTNETLFFDGADKYIKQLKRCAGMLGRQVHFLCGEAASIPHEKDERLYWLQNWPLTMIDSPVYDDKPFALKMSVRGGWVWLTEAERNLILQGGQVSRLSGVSA